MLGNKPQALSFKLKALKLVELFLLLAFGLQLAAVFK